MEKAMGNHSINTMKNPDSQQHIKDNNVKKVKSIRIKSLSVKYRHVQQVSHDCHSVAASKNNDIKGVEHFGIDSSPDKPRLEQLVIVQRLFGSNKKT